MTTKVSSELFAIQMKYNDVFDGFQYLDESIVLYLDEKGGRVPIPPQAYKHIENIIKSLKAMDYLVIKTIANWEEENEE